MSIFQRYIWNIEQLEVPVLINDTKDKHCVKIETLKLQSKHHSLNKMHFIPRDKLMPLLCYEEGSLKVTVDLDIGNVYYESVIPEADSPLASLMIKDCDLVLNNLSAAEAVLTGLCAFAAGTNLVSPFLIEQHHFHFENYADQINGKELHGKYHQLVLSFCDVLLQQFSREIAEGRRSTF